ncbi:MAG: HNH endonuclease [Myxococcales bacterium]|nr:HNH endonuclease [Myxococcales bacterium]
MRPVERGPVPVKDGQVVEFAEYQDAKPYLLERLGNYCSYCGMRIDAGLHVEHVSPKSIDPERCREWNNLLLACVHCNSIKSAAPTREDDCFPDTENPMLLLEYGPDARVRAMPGLTPSEDARARRIIDLVGLDRTPEHSQYSKLDYRWIHRREAWDIAWRSLRNLRLSDTVEFREQIIATAVADGYWPVWYAAFAGDVDLRCRLVRAVRGTCQCCFDDAGAPIARP